MAETPFKLRSGNTTPFKQMGSTPAKHIGRHPSKKDDHVAADHRKQGLFQALTGTKLGDVKIGKKPKEGEEDTRKSLKETRVGKQVSKTASDIRDLGTDIQKNQLLGTTKKDKIAEAEEKEKLRKEEEKNKKPEITHTNLESHAGDPYEYRKSSTGDYSYRKGNKGEREKRKRKRRKYNQRRGK